MPDEPNIHQPEWDAEMPDAPFRAKAMRAGAHAGSHIAADGRGAASLAAGEGRAALGAGATEGRAVTSGAVNGAQTSTATGAAE